MRYSAIRIFDDGSFKLPRSNEKLTYQLVKAAAMSAFKDNNMADKTGKLKAFFNKNKYVIVTSSDYKDIKYIIFSEPHSLFNLPVLKWQTPTVKQELLEPIRATLKGLLTDFNAKN
jgi:hypothetical protein